MAGDFDDQLEDALPDLWKFAFSLTRNRDDADDLLQDAVLRAIRKRYLHLPGRPVKPWVAKILLNCFRNAKRRMPLVPLGGADMAENLAAGGATAEDRLEIQWLWKKIAALPEEQRIVLLAVAVAGLSYDETARTLGIPQGTVMSRLSRARARLRKDGGNTLEPVVRSVK